MANEGFLGKTKISGEKAATDDHPVIIHALPLDESVDELLPAGLLMERTDAGTYKPYDPANGGAPRAVVNEPCDPTGTSAETSAKCIVHGCAKTRLLKVADGSPADYAAIIALTDYAVFAV